MDAALLDLRFEFYVFRRNNRRIELRVRRDLLALDNWLLSDLDVAASATQVSQAKL